MISADELEIRIIGGDFAGARAMRRRQRESERPVCSAKRNPSQSSVPPAPPSNCGAETAVYPPRSDLERVIKEKNIRPPVDLNDGKHGPIRGR